MVTSTENEQVEQKIINQVEYYFGNFNLKRDKFMQNEVKENDGWFPIEKLLTFNRLKTLTGDKDEVIKCIKKSTSGLLELNENETKLRRITPMPEESEEYIKELNLRTLHLKGFPTDSVLDDIMQFCSKFGKVESIEMRRDRRKEHAFKGCIMVTFGSKDDAQKILDSEEELKYNENVLMKENKETYFQRKKAFYESKANKAKESKEVDVIKTKGAILNVNGFNKDMRFMDVKNELSKISKVAFVSSVNEQSECKIRFYEEDGAKLVFKTLKEKVENLEDECEKFSVEICGQKVEVSLPSEAQEKEFWTEYQNNSNTNRKGQKGKKRSHGGYNGKNKRIRN